jgi:formylglycine-generating enzyme required for sulfatase activity
LKAPNAFGLYDMLGNASEWVLDRYYNKYDLEADAVGPHIDLPLTGNSSAAARGGYWDSELSGIRVSRRIEMLPDQEGPVTVRCARDGW